MIITDGLHLVSTVSEDELHAFAKKISLKREWYQCRGRHPKRKRPHYDLTTKLAVNRAIRAGAKLVSGSYLIKNAFWEITFEGTKR